MVQTFFAKVGAREYAAYPTMQQVIVQRYDGPCPSWKGPCPECGVEVHLFHGQTVTCGNHNVQSRGATVFVWDRHAVDRAAYDHETE